MSDYTPRYPSRYYQINQLTPELVGIHALNPLFYTNSPSRNAMFASHWSQRLVILGADQPIIQSLVESDWAKYTFSVRMPENGRILRRIERYQIGVAKDSIQFSPDEVVLYQKDMGVGHPQHHEIDMFRIPHFASLHQYFGFEYVKRLDAMAKLYPNAYIPKDTIFADSPSVSEEGELKGGLNLNTAFMSVPGVEEDGFVVCEDVLPMMAFDIFENRSIMFGGKKFPLNKHGAGAGEYKICADIGEDLPPDGCVMMTRSYDSDIAPATMSIFDVREPDYYFDSGLYARGGSVPIEQLEKHFMESIKLPREQRGASYHQSLGRVVDIKVIVNNSSTKKLPDLMRVQVDKYAKAYKTYLRALVDAHAQLIAERKKKFNSDEIKLSQELGAEIARAMTILDVEHRRFGKEINFLYRKTPIDEVFMEFTIQYRIIPTIGFKLSNLSGGKGVICQIWPRKNMPVDAAGNSADIITNPDGTYGRMIFAMPYLHQMASVSRKIRGNIRMMAKGFDIEPGKATIHKIQALPPVIRENMYHQILVMQDLIDPRMADYYRQMDDEKQADHLSIAINQEVYMACPIDVQKLPPEIVDDLERTFQPPYGPVKYIGGSGREVETYYPVRIAPLYWIVLEKISDEWSAVSTGKLQAMGVLSTPTRSEKFSLPFKPTPVRALGETEMRLILEACGRLAVAETYDRSNSVLTQRNMVYKIVTSPEPTNIAMIVDRSYINYGSGKPTQLFRHMSQMAGFVATYRPELPYRPMLPAVLPDEMLTTPLDVKLGKASRS